jgi:hypothetical protein
MDTDLVTGALSGGAGIGAVWILVRGIGKWIHARGEKDSAEAMSDTAAAKAVLAALGELHDLKERVTVLERNLAEERTARLAAENKAAALEERCKALEDKARAAEEDAARWERRGEIVASELREWHRQGKPSTLSARPPAKKLR